MCTLLHVEDEPFKIFALRMVDIDGMIGGLVQLMQNPHFSMSLSSSRKDSRAEVLLRYHLRATEGEQDASVLDLLQSFDVQADISLQRIVQSRAVLGESGWIKNDEIIAVVVTVEIIESIVADGLMALITREVHSHVELRELNSLCAAVYRMHNLGTASHGIDREASRIAEHVKHALALGIVLKQGAIFTLVNKESCLLAFEPVDMKLQSVLHGHIVIGVSIKEPVFLMEVFLHRQCRLTLVEHIFYSAFHHLEQRLADPVTAVVHAHAVRLNDSGLTVAIDDEPRR